VGEFVPDRSLFVSPGTLQPSSGSLLLSYFTARLTETVTTLTVNTAATAAAATPTLCRMAVFSVAANGDLTQVGITPNDTTLFAAAGTAYPKNLSASFVKIAGQRYALAMLIVTAAASPSFIGMQWNATAGVGAWILAAPTIVGRVTSQTDILSSYTSNQVTQYSIRPAYQLS
jgi:hypothetical protein